MAMSRAGHRAPHVGDRRQRHDGVAQPVRREMMTETLSIRSWVSMHQASSGADARSADPLLSVVMPVFNERNTIEEIIRRVLAVPMRIELIVVDDGSTDGTGEILDDLQRELGFTLLRQANAGKGAALRRGFAAVTGDLVVIQDADLEYSPEEYPATDRSDLPGPRRRRLRIAVPRAATACFSSRTISATAS